MNYIKSLHIEGFKKFSKLDVSFNEHMNILVGENEAGKSTILDAIRTVLNQQYKNSDKSILRDLFNTEMVKRFEANPSVKTLPEICIELVLELETNMKEAAYFYGEVYGDKQQKTEKFGIRFECRYDAELGEGIEQFIADGKIPYEYYSLTWKTFANRPYQIIKRPLNLLSINTTDRISTSSFNYYNKTLFMSKYDEATRAKAKNEFSSKLHDIFNEIDLPEITENRKFGIDGKKVILENVISVLEDMVPLENHGSGMESLIKTQIALDRRNGLDVLLMEEPENHLSSSTLHKMLNEISNQRECAQIIVATHNNVIASRLNLKNVLWITRGQVKKLTNVPSDVADFFVRANNNSFLQLLLSKKVFLVEGTTEFLLLPKFYEQLTGRSIEDDGISIISCNGISYERYLKIAEEADKKIAVITDNDRYKERIQAAHQFNQKSKNQKIFLGDTVNDWTWEACIYNVNKSDQFDNFIAPKANAKYLYHNQDVGRVLGKMLNNKVDIAYQMLTSDESFKVPSHIQDAVKWLSE